MVVTGVREALVTIVYSWKRAGAAEATTTTLMRRRAGDGSRPIAIYHRGDGSLLP